jgi:hypothetical protein
MKVPLVVVNDQVTFARVLRDNHNDWNMSSYMFKITKQFLGKTAKVLYVQTHFEDDGSKSFFLDVIFPCGHEMKRVNFLCFELQYH